jgi:hypothetical protein
MENKILGKKSVLSWMTTGTRSWSSKRREEKEEKQLPCSLGEDICRSYIDKGDVSQKGQRYKGQ